MFFVQLHFVFCLSDGFFCIFSFFFNFLLFFGLKSRKKRVFSCIGYSFTRTGHSNRLRPFIQPGPRRKGTAHMSDDTKIEVEIFCGMTCYMLGNARILNIGAHLPEKWLPNIELMVSPCPVDCGCLDLAKAPFARINGQLIQNATLESVCAAITEIIQPRTPAPRTHDPARLRVSERHAPGYDRQTPLLCEASRFKAAPLLSGA